MVNEIKRMHYFDGQFLNAADFQLDQEYYLRWRRRLNRYLFSPGVLYGLEVTLNSVDKSVMVKPGLALDRAMLEGEELSREIMLTTEQRLDLSAFNSANPVYITLEYGEELSDAEPERNGNDLIHYWEHGKVKAGQEKPKYGEKIQLAVVTFKVSSVKGQYQPEAINYKDRTEAGLGTNGNLKVAGNVEANGKLTVKGSVDALSYLVNGSPTRNDLAEVTPANPMDNLEVGDVVVIDYTAAGFQVKKGQKPHDTAVYGIVSSYEQAAIVIGGVSSLTCTQSVGIPVALAGRVKAKISAEGGAVKPGDLLTTAAIPGHLMRCAGPVPGAIVGKALEPWQEGCGIISVLATLQ